MSGHTALRLPATLLFIGALLSLVAGLFHPGRQPANNHPLAFAEYASNAHWTSIHLGQFAGMMVIIAGLVVLFFALNVQSGKPRWAGVWGVGAQCDSDVGRHRPRPRVDALAHDRCVARRRGCLILWQIRECDLSVRPTKLGKFAPQLLDKSQTLPTLLSAARTGRGQVSSAGPGITERISL